MAHSRSVTETIIDMLVDDVLARFPRILARLVEADSGLGVEGFGGLR